MNAKVLCNWQPSRYDAETIEREFKALCQREGIELCGDRVEVRSPHSHKVHAAVRSDDPAYGWHQDTTGYPWLGEERRADRTIIMWSNVMPTEVAQGFRRLSARDGDVLLVDNLTTKHRTPKGTEKAERWFVRAHTTHQSN